MGIGDLQADGAVTAHGFLQVGIWRWLPDQASGPGGLRCGVRDVRAPYGSVARNPGLDGAGRQGQSEATRMLLDPDALAHMAPELDQVGGMQGSCLGAVGSGEPESLSGCSRAGPTAAGSRASHLPAGGEGDGEGKGLLRVTRELATGLRCEATSWGPSTPSCPPHPWPGGRVLSKCFLPTGHRLSAPPRWCP